jgi:hypothetical protein
VAIVIAKWLNSIYSTISASLPLWRKIQDTNIIRAIIAGERNPVKLAALKDHRIRSSHEEIAKALSGNYRAELIFILQQELDIYELYQQQIGTCNR